MDLSGYPGGAYLSPEGTLFTPIAPWFEQLGLGIQYKLDGALLPAAGSSISVSWLLTNGYLVEENPV